MLAALAPCLMERVDFWRKNMPLVWPEPECKSNPNSSVLHGSNVAGKKANPSTAAWQVPWVRAGDKPERGFALQQPAEEGITATALLSVRGSRIQLCLEVGTLGLFPSSCTDFQSCELERPLCPWAPWQPRASRAYFPC